MNLYPLDKAYKLKLSRNLGLTLKEMEHSTLEEIEARFMQFKKIRKIKPLNPKSMWLIGRGNVFVYLGELLTESWLAKQIARL